MGIKWDIKVTNGENKHDSNCELKAIQQKNTNSQGSILKANKIEENFS